MTHEAWCADKDRKKTPLRVSPVQGDKNERRGYSGRKQTPRSSVEEEPAVEKDESENGR